VGRGNGEAVQLFKGHENSVKSVAFSPDGKQALSGSTDATVRLWDIDTAKEVKVFRKHSEAARRRGVRRSGPANAVRQSRRALILPWVLVKATTNTNPNPDPTPIGPNPIRRSFRSRSAAQCRDPGRGTVGNLWLSPDRQWLFYLNLTEAKVGKINTKTARREKELKLADGTTC